VRALLDRRPTPEQLAIIRDPSPGVTLIRGAAGSGKTSTAIWRLKVAVEYWRARMEDGFVERPIRVLVLTFNRTLRGYVDALAQGQVVGADIELDVNTFGHWGHALLGWPEVWQEEARRRIIGERLGGGFPWQPRFIVDEVDYVLGRYLPEERERYLTEVRYGRGAPSLKPATKQRFYHEIILPYLDLKERRGLMDWQDEAVQLAQQRLGGSYQIVVIDETQDFSANQVRAVLNHADDQSTVTFILDAAQRIYPHSFLWSDVTVKIHHRHTLRQNHRNTRPVAAFCQALVNGLNLTDDGTLPDFESCTRSGPKPVLVPGRFRRQMDHVIEDIRCNLQGGESAAILHALGGGWFDYVRERLGQAGVPFVEISGQAEWPTGEENVALSTMASAKGLEFDHVYIVGLNAQVTPHGGEEGDDLLERHRRLLAMAAGRARCSVTIGYKPEEASTLIDYMDPDTYEVSR
jgi:superfamily I DNA/RNA helicase